MNTDRSAGDLAPLARSWSRAPAFSALSGGLSGGAYSLAQRCYEFACKEPITQPVEIAIAASNESPVVNIALMLRNFGDAEVALEVDGKPVPRGKDFRYSHEGSLEGTDLCVWIPRESIKPVILKLMPVGLGKPE